MERNNGGENRSFRWFTPSLLKLNNSGLRRLLPVSVSQPFLGRDAEPVGASSDCHCYPPHQSQVTSKEPKKDSWDSTLSGSRRS